jgi:hypothetical protein
MMLLGSSAQRSTSLSLTVRGVDLANGVPDRFENLGRKRDAADPRMYADSSNWRTLYL